MCYLHVNCHGLDRVAGAVRPSKSVSGTTMVPAGTTATVNVLATNRTFPVTDGRLSIPLN